MTARHRMVKRIENFWLESARTSAQDLKAASVLLGEECCTITAPMLQQDQKKLDLSMNFEDSLHGKAFLTEPCSSFKISTNPACRNFKEPATDSPIYALSIMSLAVSLTFSTVCIAEA